MEKYISESYAKIYKVDRVAYLNKSGAEAYLKLHYKCTKCNADKEKGYSYCDSCKSEMSKENYLSRKNIPWKGEPLYDMKSDTYFFDEEELYDFIDQYKDEEGECPDLRLVPCREVPTPYLDYDQFDELMDEDGEFHCDIEKHIDAFNESVKGMKSGLYTGKSGVRVTVDPITLIWTD